MKDNPKSSWSTEGGMSLLKRDLANQVVSIDKHAAQVKTVLGIG